MKEIRNLTGDGVDLTLEATGVPAVLEQTVPITRPRGKYCYWAATNRSDQSLPLTFIEQMMRRELSIIGCLCPIPRRSLVTNGTTRFRRCWMAVWIWKP